MPLQKPFRHTASLILLGLGLTAGGVALGLGLASNNHIKEMNAIDRTENEAIVMTSRSYEAAFQTGLGATILWISSSSLLGAGAVALIYELFVVAVKRSKPRMPMTPNKTIQASPPPKGMIGKRPRVTTGWKMDK